MSLVLDSLLGFLKTRLPTSLVNAQAHVSFLPLLYQIEHSTESLQFCMKWVTNSLSGSRPCWHVNMRLCLKVHDGHPVAEMTTSPGMSTGSKLLRQHTKSVTLDEVCGQAWLFLLLVAKLSLVSSKYFFPWLGKELLLSHPPTTHTTNVIFKLRTKIMQINKPINKWNRIISLTFY